MAASMSYSGQERDERVSCYETTTLWALRASLWNLSGYATEARASRERANHRQPRRLAKGDWKG